MSDCIFCKIVAGEVPSYKLYEDEDFFVFLDAFPAHKGHTLIIPKKHYENIFDLPESLANKVMGVGKKIAQAIEDALNADGYNFAQNNREHSGQAVMHYHLHLIPRFKGMGGKGAKHMFDPKEEYKPTKAELEEVANKILSKI